MAYPTFVAAGAAISIPGNGTAAAVAVPAGVASGDLLLCVMLLGNGNGNTPTGPSGFTAINSQGATTFSAGVHLYYKIASGSEPGTYNVSQSGANLGAARMYAWTGTHATTPINVNSKSAALNGITTINLPSATTTVAECLHVGVSFEYNGRTPTISATGSQTARGGSTLSGRVFQVTDEQIASAGAVTGKTHSSGTSGDFYAFSVGIAPVGVATITGSSSITLSDVTTAAAGTVVSGITGASAITLGALTTVAAGTVSGAGAITGASSITLGSVGSSAAGVLGATLTVGPFKNKSGTVLASQSIAHVVVLNATSRAVVVSLASQTTNGSGMLAINNGTLVPGTGYMVASWNSDGSAAGNAKVTAAA